MEKVKALSKQWRGSRTILFEQKHRGEAGRAMLSVSDTPNMKKQHQVPAEAADGARVNRPGP